MSTSLEEVDLRGQVRGLREWNEGYDYLEAIAFSFVVEFRDNTDNWSMFADSEEEKVCFLLFFVFFFFVLPILSVCDFGAIQDGRGTVVY